MPVANKLSTSTHRLEALDGLRGLAALVVVIHHCLMVNIDLNSFFAKTPNAHPSALSRALLFASPLHDLWNGPEAVFIFFVLSGLVLARPFLATTKQLGQWIAFYPKRLVRLYLPIIGSLIFALGLVALYPRQHSTLGSSEFNGFASGTSLSSALHDLVTLPASQGLNAPLWSLRPEIICSMLLPLFVYLVVTKWLPTALKVLGIALAIFAGSLAPLISIHLTTVGTTLSLAGAFAAGALLAQRLPQLRTYASTKSRPLWFWLLALLALGTAMNAPALASYLGLASTLTSATSSWIAVVAVVAVVAAVGLVALVLAWTRADRTLSRTLPTWLGQRSFALYLVHLPVVVAAATALGPNHPLEVLGLGLPASLLCAEIFYRVVDRPSHRLAGRVGARVTRSRKFAS